MYSRHIFYRGRLYVTSVIVANAYNCNIYIYIWKQNAPVQPASTGEPIADLISDEVTCIMLSSLRLTINKTNQRFLLLAHVIDPRLIGRYRDRSRFPRTAPRRDCQALGRGQASARTLRERIHGNRRPHFLRHDRVAARYNGAKILRCDTSSVGFSNATLPTMHARVLTRNDHSSRRFPQFYVPSPPPSPSLSSSFLVILFVFPFAPFPCLGADCGRQVKFTDLLNSFRGKLSRSLSTTRIFATLAFSPKNASRSESKLSHFSLITNVLYRYCTICEILSNFQNLRIFIERQINATNNALFSLCFASEKASKLVLLRSIGKGRYFSNISLFCM